MPLVPVDEGEGLRAKAVKVKPRDALADCDRITCQAAIHHEQCGGQPETAQLGFSSPMETRGLQMYGPRRITIGEQWETLDFGWLKDKVGFVVIRSLVGFGLRVNPTDEERALWARQVVCVAQGGADKGFVIRAGRGFMGELDPDGAALRVRVSEGQAMIEVSAMPR